MRNSKYVQSSCYTDIGSTLSNNIKFVGTREGICYLNKIADSNVAFKCAEEDIQRTIIDLPKKFMFSQVNC